MIPPFILSSIAKNGSSNQKKVARRTLILGSQLRAKRLAPIPSPQHLEGEDRDVHDAQNGTNLPGVEVRTENDPPVSDKAANEAYDGSGNTFEFYDTVFSRHSLDGKGMALLSTVHYDVDFCNAFFDGQQMVYGDGDNQIFVGFTHCIDVIAHELSHGVTQFTANLEYQDQPGALNEHVSDAMGSLVKQFALKQTVDKADWLIGDGLFTPNIQGRALRDMLNPGTAYDDPVLGKDPQPAHMNDLYTGWEDNGGVHINSGIPNKAFATAALLCGGNAWETVGPVWYKVLTTMAKNNTNFQGWANMTYAASTGAVRDAIKQGWEEVGITASDEPQPEPEPEPGPSPCLPDILAVLSDPVALELVRKLGKQASIRRMIARARLL